jgi:hypothetical protein
VGKLDVLVLAANFSSGLVRRPVAAMALEPRTSFPSWSRRRRNGG